MADHRVPTPTAEHRRIAAEGFERARQVITTGNFDYGIRLLLTCCKIDPASLIYRQELRRSQKAKHNNNLRGGMFAFLTTASPKAKVKTAKRARDYLKVLEHGEQVLTRNPWDLGTQMDMAEAADALGLLDVAIFILDQARQKHGNDPGLNRRLARLFEKRGNFAQAIKLWELVRKAVPADVEATHKAKDLAASETIQRGQYENAMEGGSSLHKIQAARAAAEHDRTRSEVTQLAAKIEANPTSPQPYLQLATAHRRAGRFEEALDVLRKGLGPTGQNFDIAQDIAELELDELRKIRVRLLKEINTREIELFRMKADRNPGELGHRLELGVRLLRAGQTEEAIAELQLARKDLRQQGKAAMYLGFCFKGRNNWRLAQRNFEEAMKQLPATEEASRKEVLYQLAQGCADAGDLTQAVDFGHELANLDFGYRGISKLIDEWQDKLQKA
jgi:tetratricopeptide (TPR) repeat protein